MDELNLCGYGYLTAAIRTAVRARFRCAVCGEEMMGQLTQICYCDEAADKPHHVNRCCRDLLPRIAQVFLDSGSQRNLISADLAGTRSLFLSEYMANNT
jgi:hypothetical protein